MNTYTYILYTLYFVYVLGHVLFCVFSTPISCPHRDGSPFLSSPFLIFLSMVALDCEAHHNSYKSVIGVHYPLCSLREEPLSGSLLL